MPNDRTPFWRRRRSPVLPAGHPPFCTCAVCQSAHTERRTGQPGRRSGAEIQDLAAGEARGRRSTVIGKAHEYTLSTAEGETSMVLHTIAEWSGEGTAELAVDIRSIPWLLHWQSEAVLAPEGSLDIRLVHPGHAFMESVLGYPSGAGIPVGSLATPGLNHAWLRCMGDVTIVIEAPDIAWKIRVARERPGILG